MYQGLEIRWSRALAPALPPCAPVVRPAVVWLPASSQVVLVVAGGVVVFPRWPFVVVVLDLAVK